MRIRAVDLGDRIILLGTERGIDPPFSIVGDEYERWKGKEKELDCLIQTGGAPEATPSDGSKYL